MKILVFGRSGQVGGYLENYVTNLPQFDLVEVDRTDLNLLDTDRIIPFITSLKPDWVINAAAHTAVDKAESEPELCFRPNAEAPCRMAAACADIGSGFVHYSTDYVFDGQGSCPYTETDVTNPKSVYGKSKREGELAILKQLPASIILRTSWVYAKKGHNFVNTMLRLARERPEINVVSDQIGSPTFAGDLAQVTTNIISGISDGRFSHRGGIFHATGQGETSWYEFCQQIMKQTFDHSISVNPISSDQYPTPAPRPRYSVLSNQKMKEVYSQELRHWKTALGDCLSSD